MKISIKKLFVIAILGFVSFFPKSIFAQSNSVSFAAVGDFGTGTLKPTPSSTDTTSNFAKVLQGIKNANTDFTIALGDFIYNNDTAYIAPWCNQIKNTLGSNYPFELIAGNHDTGESNADIVMGISELRDCLPHRINNIVNGTKYQNNEANPSYAVEYYFDYPDATNPIIRVILISPGLFKWQYTKGTANYNFVKNSILDARDPTRPNGPIPWVFLGMHKNCVTNGIKTCEYSQDLMNLFSGKDLGPNGTVGDPVDIVFEGHEHTYHRSKPLKINNTTCTSIPLLPSGSAGDSCINIINNDLTNFLKTQGSIYNIVGTGGVAIRSLGGRKAANDKYYAAWMGSDMSMPAGGNNSWGFTKVTATRTSLNAEFIATTGKYHDAYNINNNGTALPTSSPPGPTSSVSTSTPTVSPTKTTSVATPTKTQSPTISPTLAAGQPSPTKIPTAIPTQGVSACLNIPTNVTYVETNVNLPTSGQYKAWSRMMSEDKFSNSYWLQVDEECFLVGDLDTMPPHVWTWVDYTNGNPTAQIKINLNSGNHKVRYYKNESNTRLDTVLFTTNQSCVPVGSTGGDCSGTIPGGDTTISPTENPTPTRYF
ncbi:MAG: metallophosphoesterase [Patescibacteria group bacterium]